MIPAPRALAACALLLAFGAGAAPAEAQNPWQERRVIDMAHQGGEWEAPSNTMFAFKRALARGGDMLELDVHGSADGHLMVIHDATVDRTTNGTGRVSEMTLAELRPLDAAYNFVRGENAVPGRPPEAYRFRGVRTGDRKPPRGYRPHDFRIPTLGKVFRRFPEIPINIEIKGNADSDLESFERNAELLADFLNQRPERAGDVIVVSFNDRAVQRFHELAPEFGTAPGLSTVAVYFTTGVAPGPEYDAIQIPVQFEGIPVATPEFIARAHADGYAVHVFPDHDEENEQLYAELLSACVDGLMTAYPTRFERYLNTAGVIGPGREDGADPCAA